MTGLDVPEQGVLENEVEHQLAVVHHGPGDGRQFLLGVYVQGAVGGCTYTVPEEKSHLSPPQVQVDVVHVQHEDDRGQRAQHADPEAEHAHGYRGQPGPVDGTPRGGRHAGHNSQHAPRRFAHSAAAPRPRPHPTRRHIGRWGRVERPDGDPMEYEVRLEDQAQPDDHQCYVEDLERLDVLFEDNPVNDSRVDDLGDVGGDE